MALPADADDATKPLDNDGANYPASVGAEEFRKLKEKLNKLFLNSGVDAVSGPDPTERLIQTNNRGLLCNVTFNPANAATILYGSAATVTRTGKDNHTVAGQFTAINGPGNVLTGDHGTFALVTQAINEATAQGTLIGGELAVANLNPNPGGTAIWGLNIVFKNRGDGVATVGAGLGANRYNKNSVAIQIDSQARSLAGEYCGFGNGIVFGATSMDLDNGVRGYCLDTYNLTYDGGVDPDTAFRVDAVIRMRSLQSILWFDGINKIKMYLDPSVNRLRITNNGTEVFGIDVVTGIPHVFGVPMNNP